MIENHITLEHITKILQSFGLEMSEFRNYQKAMPDKRRLIHVATLAIFATLKLPEYRLASLLKIDRGKLRRMRSGADVDQLPSQYSKEEIETVREMVLSGNTYATIAEAIGRSPQSVQAIAVKSGNTLKKINPSLYYERVCIGWEKRNEF